MRKFFSLADFTFCVESDLPLDFGSACAPFVCEETDVDACYHISAQAFSHCGQKVHTGEVYSVFADHDIRYRLFEKGVGGFLLVSDTKELNHFALYGNAEDLLAQSASLVRGYLGLEVPLLRKGAFLLHSSLVRYQNRAILFSGPSGIGKSTQAALWQSHKNADVLNGDRALIQVSDASIRAYGSFFAGSSGIYKNESADVAAVVILSQAPENHIERLSGSAAFFALFSQCLQNPWDADFTKALSDRITDVVSHVPVFKLACRPDFSAVKLLHDTVFNEKEDA